MRTIEAVRVELAGWRMIEDSATLRQWQGTGGDLMTLQFFAAPDPSPFDVRDTEQVRAFARMMALRNGGGLVEADKWKHGDYAGTRGVTKIPQQPSGFTYVGDLIAQRDLGFAIKVECREEGTTGLRETAVALALEIDPAPGLFARMFSKGPRWHQDPYDAKQRAPVMRSQSDDRSWDDKFPDHPLSRLRCHLKAIDGALRVA